VAVVVVVDVRDVVAAGVAAAAVIATGTGAADTECFSFAVSPARDGREGYGV
jgi:hypothetical protein